MINSTFISKHKYKLVMLIPVAIGLFVFFMPDIAFAVTIEDQLNKVGGLMSGKVKKIGLSSAAIIGCIVGVFTRSPKTAGIVILAAVMSAGLLQWIDGGMKVGNITNNQQE